MMENIFDIKHESTDGKSRTGVLHLPHGDVQTPVFMFVVIATVVLRYART